MTERIQNLLRILKSGEYKKYRSKENVEISNNLIKGKSRMMIAALRLCITLEHEKPYILPGERIGFHRYLENIADFVDERGNKSPKFGPGNNIPDYESMLRDGMDVVQKKVAEKLVSCEPEQKEFYEASLMCMDAVLAFADRCKEDAKKAGASELYEALCRIPHRGATNLLEACIFLRFMIFTLRCNNNTHVTLGRFDKYMRPYYEKDLAAGRSREELLEIVEEFFVSINFDTDLYAGVQLGDNGQSMVLGGFDLAGTDCFDDFSRLCMEASLELNLIDPKVNLRVSKKTSVELLEFATLMTKQGMGFPQYCNDDVVIPGLIKLGYAPEDAVDYAVAACWEYIIPGKGYDIPNIKVMNFPKVVDQVVRTELMNCVSFEEFFDKVKQSIVEECDVLIAQLQDPPIACDAYMSLFVQGCIESGKDIETGGAIYNNYGFHGAGIAVAADALMAVKEVIYDKAEYDKETLLDALKKNYEGYGELRNRLLACPKMGNNEDCVDEIANQLMDTYAGYLNGKPNRMGGIYRAGTGSAHYYIYESEYIGATPDGRKAGEPFGSSFSPALTTRLEGPLSCIQSFTKYDMTNIINGGPHTIEIHDTTFRNEDGIKKVALLVKAFIDLGGHQLQLNAINRERLLDAQAHPEDHKNLIVRVWGWSGYFVELDRAFQDHIIRRTEFKL